MPLTDLPKLLQEDDYTATLQWRSIVFNVWREKPMRLESAMAAAHKMLEVGHSLAPRKMALVVLLNPHVSTPNAEVRKYMDQNTAKVAAVSACQANIHSGTGFAAATVRGVITALSLVSRSPRPEKVFSNDLEAIVWMAHFLRDEQMQFESTREIHQAFEWVRANVAM